MKRIALALHGGVVNMVGGVSNEGEAPAYRVDDSRGQCHPILCQLSPRQLPFCVIACHPVTSHSVIACQPVTSHSVIVWPASGCCQHAVFNLLLVASLKNMAALLDRHMPPQGKGPSRRPHLTTAVRQYLRDLVVVSGHWSGRLVHKDSLVPPPVHCLSC